MPPVDRPTFDADQATETTTLNTFISAVQALLANQAVLDLSAEDATVQSQIAAINAVILPTPPGPAKPKAA
jgi:hypothetical protein